MLKVLIWIVGIIMVLALVAMCAVAWILTPATLTPLVRSQAGKFLDADVGLGRIELTVWSSFPRLMVEVDSLSLRSRRASGRHQVGTSGWCGYVAVYGAFQRCS